MNPNAAIHRFPVPGTISAVYFFLALVYGLTWIAPQALGYATVYFLSNAVILEIMLVFGAFFGVPIIILIDDKIVFLVIAILSFIFGLVLVGIAAQTVYLWLYLCLILAMQIAIITSVLRSDTTRNALILNGAVYVIILFVLLPIALSAPIPQFGVDPDTFNNYLVTTENTEALQKSDLLAEPQRALFLGVMVYTLRALSVTLIPWFIAARSKR